MNALNHSDGRFFVRNWVICIVFVGFGWHASASIEINYNAQKQEFAVTQCFTNAPDYIEAKDREIIGMTSKMHWQNQAISFKNGYAELPDSQPGCVYYEVHPKRTTRLKEQHPDSLLIKIDQLLWQASDHQQRPMVQVTINHPSTVKTSAPWQLLDRASLQSVYRQKPTPKYADGYLAFGSMMINHVKIGNARLRLAVMAGSYHQKNNLMVKWIEAMAGTVAEISNGFPIDDIQVLVILVDGQGGAVPWGQVNRGGGQGVLFVVNANKSEQQLFEDWTAAHEFSHLLTPYTPYDRWLSEGFASYHQNISRLRAGLLDELTAWQKLVAGFERGKRSASKSTAPKLKKSNRKHNMQMYWGGAVIALKADVALQRATQGSMNLSMALAGLKSCCLATGKGWTAKQLFTALDEISETDVFMTLYKQDVLQQTFPEYRSVLKELGIKQSYSGKIVLDDQAPIALIRKRIAQG